MHEGDRGARIHALIVPLFPRIRPFHEHVCLTRRSRLRSEQPTARLTNRRRDSAPSVLDRGRHAVEPVCPCLHHRSTLRQMIGVVVAVEAGLHVVTGGPSCCALRCSPLGRPGVLTARPLAVPHRSPGCRE